MNLIHTDYHGDVTYCDKDLICFPNGLFGFPDLKQYLPLYLNKNDDSIILLQSVEEPLIVFAALNPVYFFPDYAPMLTTEELEALDSSDSGTLSYYVLCSVKKDYRENTVNLKAPLAVNPNTRQGIQVILENSDYSFRCALPESVIGQTAQDRQTGV